MSLLLSTDFKILDVYNLEKKELKSYILNSRPSRFCVASAAEIFSYIKENIKVSNISVIVFVEPVSVKENFALFEEAAKHGLTERIAICNADSSACSSFIYELRPKLIENPRENELFCFLYSRNNLNYGCLIQRNERRFIYVSSACVAEKEDYINLLKGKQNIGELNGTIFAEKVQEH
uniref:Uncharacterized protein n=1 Tax=Panagrolaimus sp. ES5 TaxID=591445 RepID=A0AC34GM13_9BILA